MAPLGLRVRRENLETEVAIGESQGQPLPNRSPAGREPETKRPNYSGSSSEPLSAPHPRKPEATGAGPQVGCSEAGLLAQSRGKSVENGLEDKQRASSRGELRS